MTKIATLLLGLTTAAMALPAYAQTPAAVLADPNARLKPEQRDGTLRLHGSNTIGAELGPELLLAYGRDAGLGSAREEPGAQAEERMIVMEGSETGRVLRGEVFAHGSKTAFEDLQSGKTDIGMSSRRIKPEEAAALKAAGLGDMLKNGNETIISLDGIVFVVHHDNPVRALTLAKLRDLMSGAVRNWYQIGGPDLPVTVYARDARSGTFDLVRERVLGKDARLSPDAKLFESSEDLADAVAADRSAIGFAGVAYVRNARALAIDGGCALPPTEPTVFQVKTEEYALARRLYLYAGDRRAPLSEDFRRFTLLPQVYPVVEHAGFVSLEPLVAGPEVTEARSAALSTNTLPAAFAKPAAEQIRLFQAAIHGQQRLSITARFEAGTAKLDARAEDDLKRLALWARTGGAGRTFTLIGHSSSDGDFAANVDLSRRRAREVEAKLRALGLKIASVTGVGPISPVACDGKPEAGNLNRRVEVWVQ